MQHLSWCTLSLPALLKMQEFRRKTLQYLTPAGLFVITFLINAIKISQMSFLLIMKGARDESNPLMLIKQFPILAITGSWQQDLPALLKMQEFRRKTLQYLTPAGLFVITFL